MSVRRYTVSPAFLEDRQAAVLVFGAVVPDALREGDRVEIVVGLLPPALGYVVETIEAPE